MADGVDSTNGGSSRLPELAQRLIEQDPPSFERAMDRYLHHDRRFVEAGPVRDRFFATVRRLHERLAQAPVEVAHRLGCPQAVVDELTAVVGLIAEEQPHDEDRFRELFLLPELITLLAQRLGLFGEEYRAFVDRLPVHGHYSPRYLNLGPTGRCNLRCRDCILWGALFQNPTAEGLGLEAVLALLDEAEQQGVTGLSFCIGEPTANLRVLDAVLARVRRSPTLHARSLVTNGRFAASPERAREVWSRILTHLGPEKTEACVFAISANPELVAQGVRPEHTVQAIEAFQDVMPQRVLLVQLIRDEGYRATQEGLLTLLVAGGLLDPARLPGEGGHVLRSVRLRSGLELVFSIMAKMPAINSPEGELEEDPYVFYLDPADVDRYPFPGLFMAANADPLENEAPEDSERISLGPDGLFYADYHFMVRQVRPLGRTLAEAWRSFRQDPVLGLLQRVGGLNELIAAYERMPADERPVPDLRQPLGRYSTVSMVAANVIFADEDLALRLARQLARERGLAEQA